MPYFLCKNYGDDNDNNKNTCKNNKNNSNDKNYNSNNNNFQNVRVAIFEVVASEESDIKCPFCKLF